MKPRLPALYERIANAFVWIAAFCFATLGPILFLGTDEPQTAPMFADNAGALDALLESPEQLIERFGILDLNTHSSESPPEWIIAACRAHKKTTGFITAMEKYTSIVKILR